MFHGGLCFIFAATDKKDMGSLQGKERKNKKEMLWRLVCDCRIPLITACYRKCVVQIVRIDVQLSEIDFEQMQINGNI